MAWLIVASLPLNKRDSLSWFAAACSVPGCRQHLVAALLVAVAGARSCARRAAHALVCGFCGPALGPALASPPAAKF